MKNYLTSMTRPSHWQWCCLVWAICWVGLPVTSKAQSFDYGNGWYDAAQHYLRLKVPTTGIYRVHASDVVGAGFDTTGIVPSNMHLVYRGIESYIHVEPAPGGGWEYVEFYGQRNDAGLDTLMYLNPNTGHYDRRIHPNPNISTFSDTSVYYLFADGQPGLRLQEPTFPRRPHFTHWNAIYKTVMADYGPGSGYPFSNGGSAPDDIYTALNPNWTWGEGYVGKPFGPGNDYVYHAPTPFFRSNAVGAVPLVSLHYSVLAPLPTTTLSSLLSQGSAFQFLALGYESQSIKWINWGQGNVLPDTSELRLQVNAVPLLGDRCYTSYMAVSYLADADLQGASQVAFQRKDTADAQMHLRNCGPGTTAIAYDLFTHTRNVGVIQNNDVTVWLPGDTNSLFVFPNVPREAIVCTDQGVLTPVIEAGHGPHDLTDPSNGTDMVLITARALSTSAMAYQAYRQQSPTHPLNVKIVYTDEIYEEFGYGSPHPYAIKRFIKYALDEWAVSPKFVMIWGRGKADIRAGGVNHVPAWGQPVSDNLFVSAFRRDTADFEPAVAIGRVPLLTDQQGLDYLAKVASYETQPDAAWMRNGLFLSGTSSPLSAFVTLDAQTHAAASFRAPSTLGRPLQFHWQGGVLQTGNAVAQDSLLQDGVGLICLMADDADSVGLAQPSQLTNGTKLPLLIGMSSGTGDFGADSLTMAEQWVLEPGKGAIASLGYSAIAQLQPMAKWNEIFCKLAFDTDSRRSLGEIAMRALDSIATTLPGQAFQNQALCMNLLGDPSLHYRRGVLQVWPGDADEDLIANNGDLLNIGLAYGDTGAARQNASLQWVGQDAMGWDSSFVSGINHVHADCNGDGIVAADDTLAIVANYGLTHNKTVTPLGGGANDPLLAIEVIGDTLQDSSNVTLRVYLGTPEVPADSAYGIAWSIFYDPQLVDSNAVTIDFDTCWLRTPGTSVLTLARHFPALGRIDLAVTRTDHTPVSGEGTIARIGIVVIDNISGKLPGDTTLDRLQLTPAEGRLVDKHGHELPLRGLEKAIYIRSVSQDPPLDGDRAFAVYPSPAAAEIYVQTRCTCACRVQIFDLSGQQLLAQTFEEGARKRINISALPAGAYLLRVENAEGRFQQKVLKIDGQR